MIEIVCLDIDGVLTDGLSYIDQNGNEFKSVRLTELDALNDIKKLGYKLAAITGEDTPIVDVFRKRIKWDWFSSGCKEKLSAIKEIEIYFGVTKEEICYMGDGKYDVAVIENAGLGICPKNAIRDAKNAADIVTKGEGGESCIMDLYEILRGLKLQSCNNKKNCINDRKEDGYMDKQKGIASCLYDRLDRHIELFKELKQNNEVQIKIQQAAEILLCSIRNGGALYLCGNGGSAADSQHIATEFVSRFYKERRAMNAEALTVNTSSLTAIGNDYAFDKVFLRQLEAKGKAGDVLIGISTSGTARNVIKAMEYAAFHGIHTILFTGNRNNNYDEEIYECVIRIPSEDTPRIQEGHIFVGHILAEYVEANMDEN